MEREEAEARAARERIATMAEELRKAELVRDRLEALDRLMTTCGRAWRPFMWIGLLRGLTNTSEF
jgi:hypothetical protein